MQKLSKRFYLISIVGGNLAAIFFMIISTVLIIAENEYSFLFLLPVWPLIIYASVIMYVLLYKMWGSIQDGQARTSAGKAIGFLFIPFYNFYWIFQVLWGWAKDYNRYIERHQIPNPKMSEPLALTWCIIIVSSPLLTVIMGFVGLLIPIGILALSAIYFSRAILAVNSLAGVAEPKSEFTVPSEKQQTFDQPEYISEEGAKGRSERLPISTRARSWRIFSIVAVGTLIVLALGYMIGNISSRSSSLGPSTPIPPRRALSFFIEKEEWNALPAGSPVYSEGKEYTIKSDLAGVTVLLTVVNHDRKKQSFRLPVILVGEDGSSFGFLRLGDVTSGGSKISSDKELFVKAGQNILVELTSTMKDYQELYDAQPLYLNVSRHDQKFALKPVPSWKSLCEKREETILQNRKK